MLISILTCEIKETTEVLLLNGAGISTRNFKHRYRLR